MAKKRPKSILVYLEDYLAVQQLTLEERGTLFTAMLEYGNGALVEPGALHGGARYLWPIFKSRIDAQFEQYAATCERNKRNRTGGDNS